MVARVGANLLWLVPGVVGGSEEYTTRTLLGVAETAPDDIDLTLFTLRPFAAAHPELMDRFETVTLPLTGKDKSARVAAESSWLAFQGRRHGLDLMHHAGGIMPAIRGLPGVLTIHDVQPLVHPEHFSPAKRAFSSVAIPRSARAARLVLTPSVYTRDAVIDALGLAPDDVRVVAHGIPDPPPDPGPDADLARLEAMGVRPPFVVYPAITYPHKNHETLVRAFATLRSEHPDVDLVLTGGEGSEEDRLGRVVSELGLGDAVHRLGRIPRADLDACIRRATALAFPSRYEGFGIPVLEAMAMGCAVVAADATAVPEVVGSAGMLVDPDDVDAWAAALRTMLEDDDRRAAFVAAGLERWPRFGQVRSAAALLDAYREASA